MIRKSGVLALTAIAVMTAAVASAQTVEEELRAAEAEWQRLWDAGDAEGLAALYAEDAMRLPPDGSRTVGRVAIQEVFEGDMGAGLELDLETTDVGHDEDGELGWVIGDQTVRYPANGEMMTGTGNYVIVYRKEADGAWRIVVDTWNDAP
jgi:uncharacterized protein (TIGR02246 family)